MTSNLTLKKGNLLVMAIKIKGIFKGFSNLRGLTAQIQSNNQNNTSEGATPKFKGNKFQFSLSKDSLFNGKRSMSIPITQSTVMAILPTSTKKKEHTLDTEQNTFQFKLRDRKTSAKLKLNPRKTALGTALGRDCGLVTTTLSLA